MNKRFTDSCTVNVEAMRDVLRPSENFDVISRVLTVAGEPLTLFYIDGFTKDGELQKLMQYFLGLQKLGTAEEFLHTLPYVEAESCENPDAAVTAVLSGQTALFAPEFGARCVLLDLRTYPARTTQEPESDRVMQGARDGFVETLVMNTALVRRRVRDPRLTMEYFNLGGSSATDVVMCYMHGVADEKKLAILRKKLKNAHPKSLTLGFQGLAETLIRTRWYNPFPKIRTTERPDTAAAQVLEGNILIFVDTSPQVMLLPTSIFDYLQQTDDYYFPPLTGSYLRVVRTAILLLSVISTPLWYLYLQYADRLPDALRFLIPQHPGALPILLQLFLTELAIDGLKIASMNTPDMLSNSLSVVGALILGDFAVNIGWLCEDVIFYMAFVAIANFAQQNHELGYAFKFVRMLILALTAGLGFPGFLLGVFLFFLLVAENHTVFGAESYLYPLLPFNGRALCRLFFRTKKHDFEEEDTGKKKRTKKRESAG